MKISSLQSFASLAQKKVKAAAGGFSMSELVVALGTGTLLITGTGVALQSTQNMVNREENKLSLRQNTVNGQRLMRSEIERSMHLVLRRTEEIPKEKEHLDINNPLYSRVVNQCTELSNQNFIPIFGIKMIELTEPVLYGLKSSPSATSYSLIRCGAPLSASGEYQETQDLFLSPILANLGAIPCPQELVEVDRCPELKQASELNLNFTFTQGKTPIRGIQEPALRIETDINSKLLKFIDPTADDDTIKASFVRKSGVGSKNITTVPTYFVAFARADKRVNLNGEDGSGGVLSGAFFKNIHSKRLRFVVDGSGSMSACVMWGEGYGSYKTYYNPSRGKYIQSARNCAFTRMEAMQGELTGILSDLSGDTKIGLQAFSTSGRDNNKSWQPSKHRLVTISEPGMRDSAIAFINTLDDPYPGNWGGTKPWEAIQSAFNDEEADTMYLLSDGQPNKDRWGGSWSSNDYSRTAEFYANQNQNRNISLQVNSTSLGLESPWMEILSELTAGEYNQIDQTTLIESSEEN